LIKALGAAFDLFHWVLDVQISQNGSEVEVGVAVYMEVLFSHVDCSHSLEGLVELAYFRVQQAQFKHVLREEEADLIQLRQLAKPL
jgi:hypothetical protein